VERVEAGSFVFPSLIFTTLLYSGVVKVGVEKAKGIAEEI